jgi:hypothetical protein
MAIKYISARALNETADYVYTRYCVEIPPSMKIEDLFIPITWAHVRNQLAKHDIVRVIAEDGSFDIDLTVREVEVGGVHMTPRPHIGGLSGGDALSELTTIAAEATPATVPIGADGMPVVRVEWLPATKWRVLGISGGEVSRDHKTESEAIQAMHKYLASAGLQMPALASIEAEEDPEPIKPRKKAKKEAA